MGPSYETELLLLLERSADCVHDVDEASTDVSDGNAEHSMT